MMTLIPTFYFIKSIFDFGELSCPFELFCLHHQQQKKGDPMMTKEKQNRTKRPTHAIVFYVPSKKKDWPDISREGDGWVHKDGKGFNFSLPIRKNNIKLTVHDLTKKTHVIYVLNPYPIS
jgi:hypothetical protein